MSSSRSACGPEPTARPVRTGSTAAGARTSPRAPLAVEQGRDEPGSPLHEVTFVVVDLETTGGSPTTSEITEVGAVKVRGGQELGEFQTLVNPGRPIPPFISVLTGITDPMVAGAPPVSAVLPAFLEFARGSVLVAHNAPFDIGFLRTAAERLQIPWPQPDVVDTVLLARALVPRDEVPDRKLGTLARLFGARSTPDHRALHDARATVDVLHALLGRLGGLGVTTLEELLDFRPRTDPAARSRRSLADGLPSAPGVYVFEGADRRPLHVGTSGDIRRRVLTYFTTSEQGTRMAEMVRLTEQVRPVVCATPLEAQVREMRLIAEHRPPYNRRGRDPQRAVWVKLTREPFPRLAVVSDVRDDGARYLGPFAGRRQARAAVDAVHEILPLRRCTGRLSPAADHPACALLDPGRCGGPCTGAQPVAEYDRIAGRAASLLDGQSDDLLGALEHRVRALEAQERFEDARTVRDGTLALARGAARSQRLAPLAAMPELVAARHRPAGGWEAICVRHGRLAGTTLAPPGADPAPAISAMVAAAEEVPPALAPRPAGLPQETEAVLRWLEQPGVRLVATSAGWTCPVRGAARARARLEALLTDPAAGRDRPGPAEGSSSGPSRRTAV